MCWISSQLDVQAPWGKARSLHSKWQARRGVFRNKPCATEEVTYLDHL